MAIEAGLWMRMLAFDLFEGLVRGHGRLLRQAGLPLRELAQPLHRALERTEALEPPGSG